mgnify:CR=1 FL=1
MLAQQSTKAIAVAAFYVKNCKILSKNLVCYNTYAYSWYEVSHLHFCDIRFWEWDECLSLLCTRFILSLWSAHTQVKSHNECFPLTDGMKEIVSRSKREYKLFKNSIANMRSWLRFLKWRVQRWSKTQTLKRELEQDKDVNTTRCFENNQAMRTC